jgi:hypothetical protein
MSVLCNETPPRVYLPGEGLEIAGKQNAAGAKADGVSD